MRRMTGWLTAVLGVCLASVAGGGALLAQQTTTSTETKQFEVVSVDGNKVVVKGQEGAKEITVGDDFRLSVAGKPVSVHDLKPGMKGTAKITTTTTTTPVHVTEIRNGEVMKATGNSLMVRTPKGIQMFSPGDVTKRNVTIVKDGQPVDFTKLHEGDRLTATIVTEGTPKVVTARQVEAGMSPAAAAATPAAKPAATPAAAAPAAPAPAAPAASPRKLPKTASPLPLVGLFGMSSLALGLFLTGRRRSSI